jgi:hypothetical protein
MPVSLGFNKNTNSMARFDINNLLISGTIGNVTFYKMYGQTYVRKKSSLSRKRVLKSAAFAKTRKHAAALGLASQIGSVIYRALPAEMRDRWLYRAITGEAASLLYEEKTEEEVQEFLWKKYIEETGAGKEKDIKLFQENHSRSTKETNQKLRKIFCDRWERQGKDYYYFKRAWEKRNFFNVEKFQRYLGKARSGNKIIY